MREESPRNHRESLVKPQRSYVGLIIWLWECGDPNPGLVVIETTSESLFIVPFFHNEDFVGRENIFQQLEILLNPAPTCQARAALYGLGGIG